MNYGRVNNVVAYSELITLEAKGLYSIICSLCGSKNYCYPTVAKLSTYSGRSKATVHRLLKQLSDKGVILRNFDVKSRMTVTFNLMDNTNPQKLSV